MPTAKRAYRKKRKFYFTPDAIARLRPGPGQYLAWDGPDPDRRRGPEHATGLCVLVSASAKAWRTCFYFRGSPRPNYLHLGRVGELLPWEPAEPPTKHMAREIEEARRRTRSARALASPSDPDAEPQDPRVDVASRKDSFEKVFREYTQHEQVGRLKNSSAADTQAFVLANCAAWRSRAIATIRHADVEKLLWSIRDGDGAKRPRPATAVRLHAHLRGLFRWASRRGGPLKTSPMADMDAPATIAARDRVYTNDELARIWRAADSIDPEAGAFVKLTMLTALRRDEVALAAWSELDDPERPTTLTVPTERVKLKAAAKARRHPVYVVPLSALAQRVIRGLPRRDEPRVFPGLGLDRGGWARLKRRLVAAGAPEDFKLHTFRHTVATHLQNRGHSEWEVGLVLNHSGSRSATAGYSHGYPLDAKRKLMDAWAAHVEGLVAGENVTVLR